MVTREHGRAIETMLPGHGVSVDIESGGHPVQVAGSVHVMLNVLLPAPDYLHGSIHMLRDPDRKKVAIWLQTPAETAPEVLVVNSDRTLRQAGQLGNKYLGQSRDLCSNPDIA